jgi:hypothetical protein
MIDMREINPLNTAQAILAEETLARIKSVVDDLDVPYSEKLRDSGYSLYSELGFFYVLAALSEEIEGLRGRVKELEAATKVETKA